MSQQVSVLGNKKLLFAIGTLAVVIVAIWLASSLLSNKNKGEAAVENEAAAPISTDSSGNQILISPQQIKQVGIQLQGLGQPSTDLQATLALQGQAEWSPESKVVLTSPVSGVVQQVLVQPLATISRNSNVLALSSPELIQIQNDILQIRAQQQLAAQTLARERQLFAEGIIAEKRVQEAQNQVQRLSIDLAAKQRMLQFMGGNSGNGLNSLIYVKSPASGSVESLQVSAGQYVETGAVLGQLVNSDLPLQLVLQASLTDSQYIHIGDSVKVDGCEITGQVQKIAPALAGNTQTQHVVVRMNANHRCLQVQQFVKAQLQSHNPTARAAWTVPSSALTLKDGKHVVFVKNQQGFAAVPVDVMGSNQQHSYITSTALQPGLEIAVSGVERLKAVWSGFGAEQAPAATAQ